MNKIKKLICKIFGHKWHHTEYIGLDWDETDIARISSFDWFYWSHWECKRCGITEIRPPDPPKHVNCRCHLSDLDVKNVRA